MNLYYKSLLLVIFYSLFIQTEPKAQQFASSFKSKNKTENLAIEKIRSLPEIKRFYKTIPNADLMINEPDKDNKLYGIQVGQNYADSFRTYFWLYIAPKTFKIYYWDITSESDEQTITLQQWRYWRTKPEWQKRHIFKKGRLIVVK